jgi:hypothetical protein
VIVDSPVHHVAADLGPRTTPVRFRRADPDRVVSCSHRWPIASPIYLNTMSNHPCRREEASEVPRLRSTKEFVRGCTELEKSLQRTLDKTFGLFAERLRSLTYTVNATC